MKNLRKTLLLILFAGFIIPVFAQPVNNPFREFYKLKGGVHWTDDLKWTNTVVVTSLGATPNNSADDDLGAINQAIDAMSAAGGGVVYFPPGIYNVSDDIMLKSNVILRGPTPNKTKAVDTGYMPAVQIRFPKYTLDTSANNGNGIANNTAFKILYGDTSGCENVAVVDLWINGAPLIFQPQYASKAGFNKKQPSTTMRNVFVFGVLNTNAALPDPNIPKSHQRPWQRYSYRFCSNIDINVTENGVVVNNRINDTTIDNWNYNQPNYIVQNRSTNVWQKIEDNPDYNASFPAGYQARFDFTEHYGISLNRLKKWRENGVWKIEGHKHFPTPQEEPDLYAPGNIISDNYLFNTMRVGIYAAGNGLKILRNVTRMDPNHQRMQTRLCAPTGAKTPQGATTFENRGLDFAGYNVVVAYNDSKVYRDKIQAYLSTDGEGILTQECCGGTKINSAIVEHNTVNTYIGLYKMRDMFNSSISYNKTCSNIYVEANTNGGKYHLHNVKVNGNEATAIQATGSAGGSNLVIDSNDISSCGSGTGNIFHSCYATIGTANAAGWTTSIPSAEGGAPCLPSSIVNPKIVAPMADTSILPSAYNTPITFTAKITDFMMPRRLSARWWANDSLIDNASIDWTDSTATLTLTPADFGSAIGVSFEVYDSSYFSFGSGKSGIRVISPTIMVYKEYVPIVSPQPEDTTNYVASISSKANDVDINVYPNPTNGQLFVEGELDNINHYQIISLSGQVMADKAIENRSPTLKIDMSQMSNGMYILRLNGNEGTYSYRLVKD